MLKSYKKIQINITDDSRAAQVEVRWGEPTWTRSPTCTHSLRVHRKLQDGLTSEISRSEGGLSLEPPGLPGEPPLYTAPQLPLSHPRGRRPPLTHPFPLWALCAPRQRKRKCLACIKLDPEDKVLGRMVHCPIETQVQRVRALGGGSRGWGGSWWTETGPVGEVGGGSLHGGARRALGLGDGGVEGAQPEQCGCHRSCRSCRSARRPSAGGRSAPARTLTATTSPGSSPSSKPCPPAEA